MAANLAAFLLSQINFSLKPLQKVKSENETEQKRIPDCADASREDQAVQSDP